jgi:hypothetical protein
VDEAGAAAVADGVNLQAIDPKKVLDPSISIATDPRNVLTPLAK